MGAGGLGTALCALPAATPATCVPWYLLEVAGSAATDEDILRSEQLWIRKLQTVNMGLNGNPGGEPTLTPPNAETRHVQTSCAVLSSVR